MENYGTEFLNFEAAYHFHLVDFRPTPSGWGGREITPSNISATPHRP
jgi:hypothetical protein